MATIENFILRFKVEGQQALDNVRKGVDGLRDDIAGLASVGGPLGGTLDGLIGRLGPLGLAATAAGVAFAGLGMKAATLADELQDMADASGVGAGQLLNLRSSLAMAGGDGQTFVGVVNKLSLAIGESMDGNEKFQKSFRELGVAIRDGNGNLRDSGVILEETIYGLSQISDPAIRASRAVEILGREAAKINWANVKAPRDTFGDQQVAELAKYRGAIDDLYVSINEKLVRAFGSLAIAMQKIDWTAETQKITDYFKAISPLVRMLDIALQGRILQRQDEATNPNYSNEGRSRPRPTIAGDQGPMSQAALDKLKAEREKAAKEAADLELRIFKSTENTKRDVLLQFAKDEQQVAEIRAQSEIREAQRTITNKQELAAKIIEIETGLNLETSKIQARALEKVAAEQKRIADRNADEANRLNIATGTQIQQYAAETALLESKLVLQQQIVGLSTIEAERRTAIADAQRDQARLLASAMAITDTDNRLIREQQINQEFIKRIELINRGADVRQQRENNFMSGVQESMKKYSESLTPLKQGQQIADSVFGNMGSALDNFVETGKLKFGDFARQVILDLLKIQLRAAATQLLTQAMGFFGFAKGAAFSGGNVVPFANGGVVNGPSVFPMNGGRTGLMGEAGPEAILPLSRGSDGKLGVRSQGGSGGAVTNNYFNISAVDAKSVSQLFYENRQTLFGTVEAAKKEMPFRR